MNNDIEAVDPEKENVEDLWSDGMETNEKYLPKTEWEELNIGSDTNK